MQNYFRSVAPTSKETSPRYHIDTTVAHREIAEHTTLINLTRSPEILQVLLNNLQPTTEAFPDLINAALKRKNPDNAQVLISYRRSRPDDILSPDDAKHFVNLATNRNSLKKVLEAAVQEETPNIFLIDFIAVHLQQEEIHEALAIASKQEDCLLVKNLLEMAKPLGTPTIPTPTQALGVVIEKNNLELLQLFLNHGIDPQALMPDTQETLLAFAIRMNADKAIKLLEPFYSRKKCTVTFDTDAQSKGANHEPA